MNNRKILLTTPDYPPKRIGGISTFVINIETILRELNIDYELFVWSSRKDIINKNFSGYRLIMNAHFVPALYKNNTNTINFVHGGEILPYSQNIFKNLYKKMKHQKILKSLHSSKYNVFVSEFSFEIFKKFSVSTSYSRDIVAHNCINLEHQKFIKKEWTDKLQICCFVRDVPHKNIQGVLKLFKKINDVHPKGAQLHITSDVKVNGLDIVNISGVDENEKEKIYQKSHLNFLLSLDHSHKGNVEGFGLTVLEAAKYGVPTVGLTTGGLVESIHHKKTGWLFKDNDFQSFDDFMTFFKDHYVELQSESYSHTLLSHGLNEYKKLLEVLI